MRIEVNGEPRELPDGATVRDVIVMLGLENEVVAVERNLEIVPRATHATTLVGDGDKLEVVQFVGGG